MKFKIYKEYGALNSAPVFAAFEQGIKNLGFSTTETDQDVSVIWSVLFHGKMAANRPIYDMCMRQQKPVIIIEVGNLFRGKTWRVSTNHINRLGFFGNSENLDLARPEKLGIKLRPVQERRRPEILIACQHEYSLQWQGQPKMAEWAKQQIQEIRKFSSRKIVVRPHPRSPFTLNMPDIEMSIPKKVPGTYDDFDFNHNYHCVINHNSGPGVSSAINGIPVITDSSSLAWPVSSSFENIENISLPDRDKWFLNLTHTEWTLDEMAQGIPLQRLLTKL